MIEKASLIIGNDNFAVKEDKFLGYALNQGYYVPREIDVVRATTATMVNEDGLIEPVAYNLLQRSQEFDNAAWVKTNLTVNSNVTIAPNGTLTADLVTLVDSTSRLTQNLTLGAGTYTLSLYVKNEGGTGFCRLRATVDGSVITLLTFEPTTTWQRFEIIFTANSSITDVNFRSTDAVGNFSFWGAQLVNGTSAKTYFPTTDRLDIARVDYTNGTKSLLVEPQRTNIIPRSEDIDTGWSKLNVTVASNQTTSPSGVLNAWKSIATSTNAQHASYDTLNTSVTAGSSYFISCFVKKDTTRYIRLNEGFTGATINFDFDTATILSETSGASNSIVQNFGNGWYRIGFKFTPSTTNTQFALYINNNSNVDAYAGTTESVYLWGCQIELGSNITSYIPTVGSSVTRNADVISKTGISNLIGQTDGTIVLDFELQPNNINGNYLFSLSDGTTSNLIRSEIFILSPTVSQFRTGLTTSGVGQGDNFTTITQLRNKMAISYSLNNFKLFINGVLVYTDITATIPSTSGFYLGNRIGVGNIIGANYKQAILFKTQLTDAECINLTTI